MTAARSRMAVRRLPLDPYYQFLTAARPATATRQDQGFGGFTVSLMAHAALLVLVALALGRAPSPSPPQAKPAVSVPLVWTPVAGGGEDAGGGGERGRRSLPGQRSSSVAKPLRCRSPRRRNSSRPSRRRFPIRRHDWISRRCPSHPGFRRSSAPWPSCAPSTCRREAGRRTGRRWWARIGRRRRRRGTRLGEGTRRGSGGDGDDGLTPGNGVSWPRLVREVKPNYTPDAMRAQVEGMVELEILVLADGSVGRVNVVRSLDARFGLDQEAINAVRRWRFDPGRRSGKAVATRVGVELSFNLR